MMRVTFVLLTIAFWIGTSWGLADPAFPGLKVVPWNGHKAATSLTFDDGDPSHLDVAIPELNQRKMHATFFLIANRIDRKDDWRKILPFGHEIGNHTLDHKHPAEMTPAEEKAQVVGANHVLQKEFGVPVFSFAYPYTEITPEMKTAVEQTDFLARGGYGNGTYVIKPNAEPDWLNVSSRMTMTKLTWNTYKSWVDEDVSGGGWMVWMIHGLEGTPSGWEPITKRNFEQILDYLQTKDIWVGTFLEVGAYFQAQKIFEKVQPQTKGGEESWSWKLPDHFPPKVFLKIRLDKRGTKQAELWQENHRLGADEKGCYTIDFDQPKLFLRLSPSNRP